MPDVWRIYHSIEPCKWFSTIVDNVLLALEQYENEGYAITDVQLIERGGLYLKKGKGAISKELECHLQQYEEAATKFYNTPFTIALYEDWQFALACLVNTCRAMVSLGRKGE